MDLKKRQLCVSNMCEQVQISGGERTARFLSANHDLVDVIIVIALAHRTLLVVFVARS